jgi:hypothetical protein
MTKRDHRRRGADAWQPRTDLLAPRARVSSQILDWEKWWKEFVLETRGQRTDRRT